MQGEPSFLLVFGITVAAIVAVLICMAVVSRLARWSRGEVPLMPQIVKSSVPAAPVIMSSTAPKSYVAPPPQTTDTIPSIPKPVSVSGTGIADFDPAAIPSDLTYEEVITILAGQMTPDGKPKYSGKKIYSWVGGNYNDFTVLMKQLRAKDNDPAEAPPVTTPVAGRSTRAMFPENHPPPGGRG